MLGGCTYFYRVPYCSLTVFMVFGDRTCLTHCFKAILYAYAKALLTITIIRFGQNVVNVVKDIALVQELVIGLLELEAPAPEK